MSALNSSSCRGLLTLLPTLMQLLTGAVLQRRSSSFTARVHLCTNTIKSHTGTDGWQHSNEMPLLDRLQIIEYNKHLGVKTINQVHRDKYVQELKDIGWVVFICCGTCIHHVAKFLHRAHLILLPLQGG